MGSLFTGAPAPIFKVRSKHFAQFAFSSLGGRWVVLGFLPGPGPERDAAIAMLEGLPGLFRDDRCLAFGVLPDEASFKAAKDALPMRWFYDAEGSVRRLYDAEGPDGEVAPRWVAIDPSQRVLAWAPLENGRQLFASLAAMGAPQDHAGVPMHAPVLIVPRILEGDLCHRLIAYYEADGGVPSGVMRERNGRTVAELDDFKRRRDATITDPELTRALRDRIGRRLVPEIEKVFQFKATRIERYIVARYDSADGGYFRPHRDNTTGGTVHRKFAVSINLNAEDFEGGDLRFPEFGPQTYRPPTGGAVVFSCSLLHEATPVTRGIRYATLPFLFDEAGEELRAKNLHLLDTSPGKPSTETPAPNEGAQAAG
ncbi:2OG-Fe(II) oxygenase [uncultured Phenylobacterium sp.]|uniref:2OG-Fe(II) oxygenase n=1 Tax=uncultured Phenylobacterium sp. TaxID=349273 RepID=UPI0025F6A7D0|nr:2OG-Fe(II) oxygenase [uncultured Phenylobacterium sp.]